jgi:hypothetical protein
MPCDATTPRGRQHCEHCVRASRTVARGTATIRIERPAIANKEEWEVHPMGSRKEVILYDKLGRPVLVRLIEYQ